MTLEMMYAEANLRRSTSSAWAVLALLAASLWFTTGDGVALAGPLEPDAALADFQLPPGFRIELVASEPEIVDPIAIAFDEDGRLWVVEMRDYPLLGPQEKPSGRIRVLRDRDGDGRFETATTFADGLLFPTGVQPWRGGAITTLAGEIAFFPDDDQDGRADRQETWYRGFATENEQLRANHPQLAADGLVYVAGGLRGGTIRNLRLPDAPEISINGRDFAFDPISGECHAVSGNGQFGLTFDDYGRRFTCSNRNPLMQIMIEQRYLDRNPTLVLPSVVHDVAAAGADSRVFPRTRALTTSTTHAGQFTAACGVEIARGNALPAEAYGNAFICEPTANLVHREIMTPAGAAMTAQPAAQGVEFLSATDEWFRPVNLLTGPDGALYVVDMYRAVIEHPEWVPEEWRERTSRRDGSDRGRIYRVVADDFAKRSPDNFVMRTRDPNELAALLDHPNSWQRETAARLLLETNDSNATDTLRRMAVKADRPVGRYQALAALERLGVLSKETLLTALDDDAPGVRELALVLAESRLGNSPALADKVLSLAEDPEARVRFQVALTLMTLPAETTAPALTAIALNSGGDAWTHRAVALSSRDQAAAVLANLLTRNADAAADVNLKGQLRELIGAVIATKDAQQVAGMLAQAKLLEKGAARDLVLAAGAALEQRGQSLTEAIKPLAEYDPEALTAIQQLFDDDLQVLRDEAAVETARIKAAQLLRFDASAEAVEPLLALLNDESSPALQVAAIGAMRLRADERIAEALLDAFPLQLPSVRQASLDLFLSRSEWAVALLNAVADEQIALADVDASRTQLLKQNADPNVRELAAKVLGAHSEDREKVVEQYQAALKLKGDAVRGKQIFLATCATCHRVGNDGVAVGPDIGDAALKPAPQMLIDILDPNRAIDANYISYAALTLSGLAHQGIIRSETDGGIVLLTAEGKSITILRDELDSLSGVGSLMPEGFERQVTVEQMADLLAFLITWRQAAALNSLDAPASEAAAAAAP